MQYEAIVDAGEALTVTLGISITASLRAKGVSTSSLDDLYKSFIHGGVTQGKWLAVLNDVRSNGGSSQELIVGLQDAMRRGKGGTGLFADLDTLLQERNRWAHGARPRSAIEARLRVLEIGPVLEQALERASLIQAPWLLTESSSFQRHGKFSVSALQAMGDHPQFERTKFETDMPLIDDTFYLLTSQGPVDLSPLVVIRFCDVCRQPEMCYADKLHHTHGVALKSFATGHVIFDQTLAHEVRNLFGSMQAPPPNHWNNG